MQEMPIILFGVGGVGRALIRQIVANRQFHADEFGLVLHLLALCDRNGAAIELGHGLDDVNLIDLVELKEEGGQLSDHTLGGADHGELATIIDMAGRVGTVVVDCTATEGTVPALLFSRDRQYKIVLANKKPLTTDQEVFNRLTQAGATTENGDITPRNLGHCRWEATVGAGLPIIATLNRLITSGDHVERMAGTFSGTLGYVMTGLQMGERFSEIVGEAHRQGYTEPDPRDDLGGIDVARKALILARGLGWEMELDDVTVEGLYPEEMAHLTIPDFMAALPELDEFFADKVETAAVQGQVLRYAASIEKHSCVVGPVTVDANSPLGRLSGTDNLVEFHSKWYSPSPLVIQGRGAGVEATAAGVLADIIELAHTK